MPLFDLSDGHLTPIRSNQQVNPATVKRVIAAAAEQVTELLGRPLFPIAWQQDDSGTEMRADGLPGRRAINPAPRLVALEPGGRVVTIEIHEQFQAHTLIDSLARAGQNQAYSRSQLADLYPGGPEAFEHDWSRFLDACPPHVSVPARLVVVAANIAAEVRPALETLSGTGLEAYELLISELADRVRVELEEVRPVWRAFTETILSASPAKHALPVFDPAWAASSNFSASAQPATAWPVDEYSESVEPAAEASLQEHAAQDFVVAPAAASTGSLDPLDYEPDVELDQAELESPLVDANGAGVAASDDFASSEERLPSEPEQAATQAATAQTEVADSWSENPQLAADIWGASTGWTDVEAWKAKFLGIKNSNKSASPAAAEVSEPDEEFSADSTSVDNTEITYPEYEETDYDERLRDFLARTSAKLAGGHSESSSALNVSQTETNEAGQSQTESSKAWPSDVESGNVARPAVAFAGESGMSAAADFTPPAAHSIAYDDDSAARQHASDYSANDNLKLSSNLASAWMPSSAQAFKETPDSADAPAPRRMTRREIRQLAEKALSLSTLADADNRASAPTSERDSEHLTEVEAEFAQWKSLSAVETAARLRRIAGHLETPVELTWVQRRRSVTTVATLTAWGTIVTEDGAALADPSLAAFEASGRSDVNGWQVWRLPDGRSLGEVYLELL